MEEFKNVSIAEACDRWPDSISHAFQLNQHTTDYFFRLEEPVFKNNGAKIRTYVQCLKFTKNGNSLHLTNLPIRNDDQINALQNREFRKVVVDGLKVLIELGGNCPPEMITPYEEHGFYQRSGFLSTSEETKAPLP